ncbi:hypothetical protein QF035_007406 [Streptomyces umbrinus]|uniref:Uncharacterized protein n=1 Tax=Streptomyces umbrinus TaxID=67370 RepID=A0ABU0T1Y1_9ACTN|nr:hypothetical protein [Streptomyces umbrinus]
MPDALLPGVFRGRWRLLPVGDLRRLSAGCRGLVAQFPAPLGFVVGRGRAGTSELALWEVGWAGKRGARTSRHVPSRLGDGRRSGARPAQTFSRRLLVTGLLVTGRRRSLPNPFAEILVPGGHCRRLYSAASAIRRVFVTPRP